MSLAHFIALQKKIPNFDEFVNGKAIAHHCDALEKIANTLSVTPIMEFYGRKWHQPDTGLATVNALLDYLKNNGATIENNDYPLEDVMSDLEEWETVLKKAKEENIKWKMKIDY
jgi:hypothetical protein